MGLIGVVLASVVGIFWHNDALQFVISFIGVIVFSGLAAYDVQRLKSMALATTAGATDTYAIVGALAPVSRLHQPVSIPLGSSEIGGTKKLGATRQNVLKEQAWETRVERKTSRKVSNSR